MIIRNLILLVATLIAFSNNVAADTDIETRIKAAFLYKFCFYVEWPQDVFTNSSSPLIIAIADEDSLAKEVKKIASGRQVNNRSIEVRRIQKGDSLSDVHVLFISDETPWQSALLVESKSKPVLTVTDAASGDGEHIIEFVVSNERIKFDIFLAPAHQVGLSLGSELLSVARTVQKDGMP